MRFTKIAAFAAALFCVSTAHAKTDPSYGTPPHGLFNQLFGETHQVAPRRKAKHKRVHRHKVARKSPHKRIGTLAGYARSVVGGRSVSLDNVKPELAAKARQIQTACGSRVVSGFRPGAVVRGSGRSSLHARFPAEAVDMQGNAGCIYSHLRGWKGGYSVDYAAVNHVHISLASDRRERGARFTHYGHHKRYAKRHFRRHHIASY